MSFQCGETVNSVPLWSRLSRANWRCIGESLQLGTACKKTVETATFAATVETLTVGVVLADEHSKIVHTNAAAEAMLAAGDPILARHGQIAARSTTTTSRLQSAIVQAATRRRSARTASAPRSHARPVTLSSSTFCRYGAATCDPVWSSAPPLVRLAKSLTFPV